MDRVRKTFFDPLATSKKQIRELLKGLPAGSAHPFSPENILLCRTRNGIDEIDISSYPETYFYNAVDLGEMAETLLRRMAGFKSHLGVFDDFQILQAPASTFKIPIVSDQITILAVSERTPTYYDFCFADESFNACCWLARNTFAGITHSGDILNHKDLLDYVKINAKTLTKKEICVFISGYQCTQITKFLGTNPALLVADHVDKVLYTIPVPLDAATIGDATICCPLVIKRDGESLICSILPKATTDRGMMCHSDKMVSKCFPEAIKSADFNISAPIAVVQGMSSDGPSWLEAVYSGIRKGAVPEQVSAKADISSISESLRKVTAKENAAFVTNSVAVPSFVDHQNTQIVAFGTGLDFKLSSEEPLTKAKPSTVVLPCIFGAPLQGPVLLATGKVPTNVPFIDQSALLDYYKRLKSIVVIVDDLMTDNARNLAPAYRINALFIVQLKPEKEPKDTDEVFSLLNSANINAVTALAGPQSLILIQIFERYYFYRGLANRAHLNTTKLAFGSDVTSIIESVAVESILDPRVERLINLGEANKIILPASGRFVEPNALEKLFEELSVDQVQNLEEDIAAAVSQLQMLLNQKALQELSKTLVSALSAKVSNVTAPLREAYIKFLGEGHKMEDLESIKKKNKMFGDLKRNTKELQKALGGAITSLANMMSSQTTSKRTHDLQRLVRQAQIQGNVAAAKSMTFDTLAGYLEMHAADMGVMLLNIETDPYQQLLGTLKNPSIDASSCCDLDSRVLHLEGFDAGIIIEQSQNDHSGPLRNVSGPSLPTLALPYLSQERGSGSMLAWVCWDEFVNLKNPYTVRWMEKCNDVHIAALRIIMRSTLSEAVASREHNIQASSPEAGNLMSALLMAAMSKLAAMRTTTPVVLDTAEDTVTRLMRGLFGNLLTIAGSGVRPLSMVWQLFGLNSLFDIPTADVDWVWYQNVVALYPYTSWPLEQFYGNLEKFLDKVIIRVVSKNENMAAVRSSGTAQMIKYCKLRNIQLEHSRTIITVFMRMFTTDGVEVEAVAARLLKQLPEKLEKESQGYTKMIKYLHHLAKGGHRWVHDDLVAANIYTGRSAAFAKIKTEVSEACKISDWAKMKESCQALIDKHAAIATLWHVKPEQLKLQNVKVYKGLLDADFGDDVDQETKTKYLELTRQVLGDAENGRVPWQVGKNRQFGDDIEPLDEAFVQEILTGKRSESLAAIPLKEVLAVQVAATAVAIKTEDEFAKFKSALQPGFLAAMQQTLSAEDVCGLMKVPVPTMRVFVQALNPDFVWEDLGENFKVVVLALMKGRSNRVESRPVKKLLALESRGNKLQIEQG